MNRMLWIAVLLAALTPVLAIDWMREGVEHNREQYLLSRSLRDPAARDSLRMLYDEQGEREEQEQALQAQLQTEQYDSYYQQGFDAFYGKDYAGAISAWDDAMKYGGDAFLYLCYGEASFRRAMELSGADRARLLQTALEYYNGLVLCAG